MKPKSIITLREPINSGRGITRKIEVTTYSYFHDGHMVRWEETNGNTGEAPIRNISGIVTVNQS